MSLGCSPSKRTFAPGWVLESFRHEDRVNGRNPSRRQVNGVVGCPAVVFSKGARRAYVPNAETCPLRSSY
ncbi:hypothetical protein GYMLUDRAFT_252164 [Collybiopsis luxurians FD-317 M1]|uniref:Uncharacterized protein n=1 Tax=Collybiopsis luxurians FD-317 M1 TaxID=944289 RepID=A0A0D0BAJ0_9AGAR|nr:hypothetical protein GYMLUDRAFT_252164 [Collybiopsis luxurians FD-317 M1]